MTKPMLALAALVLLAIPAAASEKIDCTTAEDTNRAAMNALAVKAIATKDKAQRCGIGRDLLSLFDRQVSIAETCKADDRDAVEAAKTNVSRKKAHFQKDCGS
jgi:hypothetical protein